MSISNADDLRPSPTARWICRVISYGLSRILWRIEFHNTENIPADSPAGLIVASNHQTFIDPFWISIPIYREIRYLAWDRAFTWPIIGWLIGLLGAIPIDLKPGGTPGTLRTALNVLKRNGTLMIFPEGSREYGCGTFLPFRTGAARLAIRTGAAILPVTITGGNRVWPRGKRIPLPGKIDIYYHPVIEADPQHTPADAQLLTKTIEAHISAPNN